MTRHYDSFIPCTVQIVLYARASWQQQMFFRRTVGDLNLVYLTNKLGTTDYVADTGANGLVNAHNLYLLGQELAEEKLNHRTVPKCTSEFERLRQ